MERNANLVMVVDDVQEMLDLYEAILTDEGYQISLHSFGPGNLDLIKKLEPSVVIVDLMFGTRLAGWELIEQMKLDVQTVNTKIILCSANSQKLDALQPYFKDYNIVPMRKPFEIDELVGIIRHLLANLTPKDAQYASGPKQAIVTN